MVNINQLCNSILLILTKTKMRNEIEAVYTKPYSVKDFARIYNVSRKTIRRWIKPFEKEIGERNGHYYNVFQVKTIFEKLGLPERISDN
jgi:predicted DNA-binding protein YlxM (UPF0122 family)